MSVERRLSLVKATREVIGERRPVETWSDLIVLRTLHLKDRAGDTEVHGVRSVTRSIEAASVSATATGAAAFEVDGTSPLVGGAVRFEAKTAAHPYEAVKATDSEGHEVFLPTNVRLGEKLTEAIRDVADGGKSRLRLSSECMQDVLWPGGSAGIELTSVPVGGTKLLPGLGTDLALLGWLLVECRGVDLDGKCWDRASEAADKSTRGKETRFQVEASCEVDMREPLMELLARHNHVLPTTNGLPVHIESLVVKYSGRGSGVATRGDGDDGWQVHLTMEEVVEIRLGGGVGLWGTVGLVLEGTAEIDVTQGKAKE